MEAEVIACKTYSSVKSQLTNKGNSSIYKKLKQNNRQKSSVEYKIGSEKRYPHFLSGASTHCQTDIDNEKKKLDIKAYFSVSQKFLGSRHPKAKRNTFHFHLLSHQRKHYYIIY